MIAKSIENDVKISKLPSVEELKLLNRIESVSFIDSANDLVYFKLGRRAISYIYRSGVLGIPKLTMI